MQKHEHLELITNTMNLILNSVSDKVAVHADT